MPPSTMASYGPSAHICVVSGQAVDWFERLSKNTADFGRIFDLEIFLIN